MALCQSLPGPASSQPGIAIGTRRAGPLGGVAAWLGFTLPSAIILVLFAQLTGSLDPSGIDWVHGLKIAAVAVVFQAVLAMERTLTPDWPRRAIAALAAVVALAWTSSYADVAIIVSGAIVGWILLAPPAPPASQGPSLARSAAVWASPRSRPSRFCWSAFPWRAPSRHPRRSRSSTRSSAQVPSSSAAATSSCPFCTGQSWIRAG